MNIFVIPSWYPSNENTLYGIFIREQVLKLAENHPELNIGVSVWGQGNNSHLLWARDHFLNILKIISFSRLKSSRNELLPNLQEFHNPALVWSRLYTQGNRKGILAANRLGFEQFEKHFGKIDLIHAQASYPGGYIAQHLSERFNKPYIITAHMSPFPFDEFMGKNEEIKSVIDEPLKKVARLIAVSASLKERLSVLGYKNLSVVHNLVQEELFMPKFSPKTGHFKFLAIGRLVNQKGFEVLLKAFSLIRENKMTLQVVGDGPNERKLKMQTTKLGLDDKVQWLGELDRPQTIEVIQACNSLVLSSRHESFGVVLAEALSCGKPIIATKCGGPEDIVNETNGLLANVNDPKDLAQKMEEMMETYNRYDSRVIRSDFEKRFSSKVITPQIVAIYREVIQQYSKEVSGKSE